MSIFQLLTYISSLIRKIPFRLLDFIFVITFFLYVLEEAEVGILKSFFNFVSIIIAFFSGILFYSVISGFLINNLSMTKGLSDALGFLFVSVLIWIIASSLFVAIRDTLPPYKIHKFWDFSGGFLFGFLSYLVITSFLFSFLMSFPLSSSLKDRIRESFSAKYLVLRTTAIDSNIKRIFGGAIEDTLGFLTVEPRSNSLVKLNFKTTNVRVDRISEREMLKLVNEEREKRGLPSLLFDEGLAEVGRRHGKDMFARGYFSHNTPEGVTPFDRMEASSVNYTYAGENLAFAQDTGIAMDGLMKSPGHKENILSPNFGKVGIGVVDGGMYGKMFVQEFTD